MAAVRHLGFVLVYLDHPRRVFVDLWVGIGAAVSIIWQFVMFCTFGSKIHSHAPFWVVFGAFNHIGGKQYQPIDQRLNIWVIAVLAVY